MATIRVLQWGLRLISAKLGRCAFCMGFALGGAVIGWAAFAAVVSFWPAFPFLHLLALWPIGFTALWLLHITTFGARVVASERLEMAGPVMNRRRVVGVFASGLGLAILASAVAAPRALAVQCKPFGAKCSHGADCCGFVCACFGRNGKTDCTCT